MLSDLQELTDSLGRRLHRAVAIDDPEIRLLTHSPHYGPVDEVRLASILHRRSSPTIAAWVLSLGIAEARGPVRIPANPEFRMAARVCVPIRCHDTLLGYLWLVDAETPLTEEDLEVASAAAEAAGGMLYHEVLLKELERGRERELLRDLLSDQAEVRRYAAEELIRGNLFVRGASIVALVARPILPVERDWEESPRLAVHQALDQIRSVMSPRHGLQLVRPDHGVLVAAIHDAARAPDEALSLGRRVHSVLADCLAGAGGPKLLVGIGEIQRSLVEAASSYQQAQQAARVAGVVGSFGPVVSWRQLGIYQMLSRFPIEQLTADVLHPGLVRLFDSQEKDWLVRTLESYLDQGCDAKATADELALHRASLYYRLRRIEQVAGVDLRRGEDRLALHLGLKLSSLAGIYPRRR